MSLDNDKVRQIITLIEKWGHSIDKVAEFFQVSKARIYQLLKEYHETGKVPIIKKRGRKRRKVSGKLHRKIIDLKIKLNSGSFSIARYLRQIQGIKIGNGVVHRILLEENMTKPDPSKSIKKRPWVRYERKHSLSAIHMDWHMSKSNGKWVCAVLDDASRMILASGEFEAATVKLNDDFRYISKKEKIMRPLMILSNVIMRLDHTKTLTGQ